MNEDFYIGYQKTAPATLARFVRGAALGIVLVAVVAAAIIGAVQQPAAKGKYDFGGATRFEADLAADPVPHARIRTEDGAEPGGASALLVGQGKHGVPDSVRTAFGKSATFTGANIARNGLRMIEVSDADLVIGNESIAADSAAPAAPEVTLEGELIDTKCYLGVMNPADGKVHRGCASLCLRGGVPPGLLTRDAAGRRQVLVLVAAPRAIDPEWAGRILRVTGTTKNLSGLPLFHVSSIELR